MELSLQLLCVCLDDHTGRPAAALDTAPDNLFLNYLSRLHRSVEIKTSFHSLDYTRT